MKIIISDYGLVNSATYTKSDGMIRLLINFRDIRPDYYIISGSSILVNVTDMAFNSDDVMFIPETEEEISLMNGTRFEQICKNQLQIICLPIDFIKSTSPTLVQTETVSKLEFQKIMSDYLNNRK